MVSLAILALSKKSTDSEGIIRRFLRSSVFIQKRNGGQSAFDKLYCVNRWDTVSAISALVRFRLTLVSNRGISGMRMSACFSLVMIRHYSRISSSLRPCRSMLLMHIANQSCQLHGEKSDTSPEGTHQSLSSKTALVAMGLSADRVGLILRTDGAPGPVYTDCTVSARWRGGLSRWTQ